jgi:transglutaminase-like putative cysteine protease
MLIRYGFRIAINVAQPTPVLALLDVHPDRRSAVVSETPLTISGFEVAPAHLDIYGNLARRFMAYPGDTVLQLSGIIEDPGSYEVQIADEAAWPVQDLPYDTLIYLLGSRYCETDELSATAWQLFGHLPHGAARVRAVVDYVHTRLTFSYGYAKATRTAADAFNERVGVCRDFAHLTIALCRCLNIPARYVNGYLGDIGVPPDPAPMDFSAWVEVYLAGRWYTVDARNNTPRIGRIVVARGRDAMDVPLIHTFGPHVMQEFKVITEEANSAQLATG